MNVSFSRRTLTASALCAALCTGCIDFLEDGDVGQLRYFGDVRGGVPLRFRAPVSDRTGNIYVLFGSSDLAEARVFVGYSGGGWGGGCVIHENSSRGAHGWIGRAQSRAWYWSGDALAEVDGRTGSCTEVLDFDPFSLADLGFKAIIPWVKETPSRTTAVAMVQSPSDPVPFYVKLDLDQRIYTTAEEFVPRGASAVTTLGVGADPDTDSGFMIVSYLIGDGEMRVEGRFVDDEAVVTDVVGIQGLDAVDAMGVPVYGEDAVVGFMQQNEAGWVAGVLATGEVVTFDRNGGRVRDGGGLQPIGVHRWEGEVFVVGLGNGRPAIARLNESGSLDAPQVWEASERATGALQGDIRIMDDRVRPVVFRTWTNPPPAVGDFAFLHPHSPHQYAQDTSLLIVAGPSYTTAGEPFTSAAVGPVGLSYP